jgi:hypothetical protein
VADHYMQIGLAVEYIRMFSATQVSASELEDAVWAQEPLSDYVLTHVALACRQTAISTKLGVLNDPNQH